MSQTSTGSAWQPTAQLQTLQARAALLKTIRHFFEQRDVLEVATPVLASAGVTDPFIDNFTTQFAFARGASAQTLHLQTSPEYAMKRLLAAGAKHIYQIGPAFRHEDFGRYHNPEFTMLEWYRSGFSMTELMDEVAELLTLTLSVDSVTVMTYQQAFMDYVGIDPLDASLSELLALSQQRGIELHQGADGLDKDDLLQLLFATCIEPVFANDTPVLVSHFPASQAALARLNTNDPRTANRFEAYYRGIELANGFHELTDGAEQKRRFEADNQKRQQLGLPTQVIDEKFLGALNAGLPPCAGVALGIDRLVMLKTGAKRIDEVIAFGFPAN